MIVRQRGAPLGRNRFAVTSAFNRSSRRQFTLTARNMVELKDISPSSDADPEELVKETTDLVDRGKWALCNGGKGLERTFKFKTFNKTWAFMNQIAEECKQQKHHPEWTNVYNRCHVRWTTHSPEGLSMRDVRMARFCDGVAGEKGEVVEEAAGVNGSAAKGTSGDGDGKGGVKERFVGEARECCGGKQ